MPTTVHCRGRLPFSRAVACWLWAAWLLPGFWRPPIARGEDLKWEAGDGFRSAPLTVATSSKVGFTLLPPERTGIWFTNTLSDAAAVANRILENGSGVAAGDVDGDGRCDLYFCRLEGGNVLYRNLGDWRFEDVTASAGVACLGQASTGAVFADVDGDGHVDLLVNSIGAGTRLFLNDGHGHFHESLDSGLTRKFGSTSMALADIDGNGTLDLYVANYRTTTIKDLPAELKLKTVDAKAMAELEERFTLITNSSGQPLLVEKGEPDFLYLNDGHGHFKAVSWTNGVFLDESGHALTEAPQDWGLTALFRDLNGDLAPDLYVCNDFYNSPDRIWLNDGHGHFRALPRLALRENSMSSMAADTADINRDGRVDLFVVDMLSRRLDRRHTQRANLDRQIVASPPGALDDRPQVMRNTLFLGRGDGTFAEIARAAGLAASEWSWSTIFLDVDLDGFEDVLITTGNAHDMLDMDTTVRGAESMRQLPPARRHSLLPQFPRLNTGLLAFRNRGDLTFADASDAWGFNAVGVAHGMALADFDGDGAVDVVVNRLGSPAGIYRHDTPAPRVAVRLRGRAPNTQGIGAQIRVTGGPAPQSQEVICGGRYLSGDDPLRVFAAGAATNLTIEVTWRNGARSTIRGARPNRIYELDETGASPAPASPTPTPAEPALFEDASPLLSHAHHQEDYDDFQRQPLLPNRLSRLGPGIAWFDLDGDGHDDLIIGAGRGAEMGIFLGDGRGGFRPVAGRSAGGPAEANETTVLGFATASGVRALLAGQSNYENGAAAQNSVARFDWASGKLNPAAGLVGQQATVGPLALADVYGDGNLALFVGGRVNPGRYPEAAASRLYRYSDGRFRLDRENSRLWSALGLVSGAVFSDLDGDGWPDLVLACEWGPIRVFHNESGKFREVTTEWGLADYRGWWNGVTVGDFDGDGRLDIVASNFGRNTPYEPFRARPLEVYFGDLGGAGTIDIVEACFDPARRQTVPWRDWDTLSRSLPFLRGKFGSYRAFGAASLADVLGETLKTASRLNANWLESTVFLNRGGRFEARALPFAAQLAPAFGVNVADLDGDGAEDIFLSQNFFDAQPETSRYAAGRGLLLRGDGHGGFTEVEGQRSGLAIYGEQRGSALGDFDEDGRVDLAVSQNDAATKLYHNRGARPGLRVRLRGPIGNPTAVGAVMRLGFGARLGPAREIHAGSGYWSQDSAVEVLATPEPPTTLQIRWPGGRLTTVAVPPIAREIAVDPAGRVDRLK